MCSVVFPLFKFWQFSGKKIQILLFFKIEQICFMPKEQLKTWNEIEDFNPSIVTWQDHNLTSGMSYLFHKLILLIYVLIANVFFFQKSQKTKIDQVWWVQVPGSDFCGLTITTGLLLFYLRIKILMVWKRFLIVSSSYHRMYS